MCILKQYSMFMQIPRDVTAYTYIRIITVPSYVVPSEFKDQLGRNSY